MFFHSSEQKQRQKEFEYWTQAGHDFLTSPQTKTRLGQLAKELLAINDGVFLPNYRNQELKTPKSIKSVSRVAFFSMTQQDRRQYGRIAAQYHMSEFARLYPVQAWYDAPIYNIRLSHSDITKTLSPAHATTSMSANQSTSSPTRLRSGVKARMQCSIDLSDTTPDWIVSRSLVAVDNGRKEEPWADGATFAHELLHSKDVEDFGPMYLHDYFGVASEVRGYHISASAYVSLSQAPSTANAVKIEFLRQRFNPPSMPFRMTAQLYDSTKHLV